MSDTAIVSCVCAFALAFAAVGFFWALAWAIVKTPGSVTETKTVTTTVTTEDDEEGDSP